jgi:hypothetical protein
MDIPEDIKWFGDSKARFLERALEREAWGNYEGNLNLGKRLIQEVQDKITEISKNLNLYQIREGEYRVAPLSLSGYVLIYRKESIKERTGSRKVILVIVDVRKFF